MSIQPRAATTACTVAPPSTEATPLQEEYNRLTTSLAKMLKAVEIAEIELAD